MGGVIASSLLVILAFLGGCALWIAVVMRARHGDVVLPDFEVRPGFVRNPYTPWIVLPAYLLTQLAVVALFRGRTEVWAAPLSVVLSGLAALVVVLLTVFAIERLSARELGLTTPDVSGSVRLGFRGFLLAYPLVLAMLLVVASERNRDNEHPLILAVQESPSIGVLVLVFVGAAVLAPLVEELVFRVVIQGTLRNRLAPNTAILLTSILFSVLHGWPQMVGLLPLAIILGWFYERTNDYWAVVTLHAVFNGFMLVVTMLVDPEAWEELRKAAEAGVLPWP